MKVVFDPDKSSLEEKSVQYKNTSFLFKRGVPREVPEEFAKMLLQEPNKFKAAE